MDACVFFKKSKFFVTHLTRQTKLEESFRGRKSDRVEFFISKILREQNHRLFDGNRTLSNLKSVGTSAVLNVTLNLPFSMHKLL